MEDVRIKKRELRMAAQKRCEALPEEEYHERCEQIRTRLSEFANFEEAQTVLLYMNLPWEPETRPILEDCLAKGKVTLIPVLNSKNFELMPFKVDSADMELVPNVFGRPEPDPRTSKHVPLQYIDLALIPGAVFDERGGRIGYGQGTYDRLIPQLPLTTRKVALALEAQVVNQVPMEAHDRFIDIIITENRVIYKI
jgi:5-formyltetrahydrofolate cyclo-ligase